MSLIITEKFEVDLTSYSRFLLVRDETPEIVKILRLLSGTARILDNDTGAVIYGLDKNYINENDSIDAENLGRILDYIFEERPQEEDLSTSLQRLRFRNKKFYEDINNELKLLFSSLISENFTESFLYLYRTLERISAACPLLYISKETDFRSAHSFLSGVFDENKVPGELGILQKFFKHYVSVNEFFRDAVLDFHFGSFGYDFSSALVSQLRGTVCNEVNSLEIDEPSEAFSVPYRDVAKFIVSLRNRTFHNKGAQANIDLAAIGGSEPLFSL